METVHVVIAGAGIIGLSLALDLAASGLEVAVLERGRAMQESSWAAAGMLSANDPENPEALRELARYSLSLYPEWLANVERLSERRVRLRTTQTLQASRPGIAFNQEQTRAGRVLIAAEVHDMAADLILADRQFLSLDEQSLDPRDLCAALPIAAVTSGVKLLEDCPVVSVGGSESGVIVQTPTGPIAAAHFVNCAGAWAGYPALGGSNLSAPTIAPRKGQMTLVRLCGSERLTQVLRTPDIYLVPRGDGTVVVGATVERAGFDKTVQPQAIASLLRAAAELWPPIAYAEVLDSWAGLRPGSRDDLPFIGRLGVHCWIAAGHFRNGILLAPGTARTLAQAIRGEAPQIDLAPFDPARFAPGGSRPLDRPGLVASDNLAAAAL